MTDNPILQAKALTPWWMMDIQNYDGLEIHPVKNYFPPDRNDTWCEPCEPHEAEFWSVYGHCQAGGIECLEDFQTYEKAQAFACKLLEAYPHLKTHGLWG